jgi:CBS domain-containing protein
MTYQRPREDHVSTTMTRTLLTAEPSALLTDAAHRMAERRVGAILVTDGNRLEGIMTERDVLRAVGGGNIDGTVGDWMTRHPDTAPRTATIGEAAAMMMHGGYRHVPIVDGDHAVGIVSIRDLLRLPSETPSGV